MKRVLFFFLFLLLFVARSTPQPTEPGRTFRKDDLVELVKMDSTLRLDIRYATEENFMKRRMYSQARAFLQRPAAEALVRANTTLRKLGYGLLIFDAYRPWSVSKKFWDETPPAKRIYVANPKKGSKHNRGCAVDLTLYNVRTGREVQMPTPYDDFTKQAAADCPCGTDQQQRMRKLLRDAMSAEGFSVNPDEWWHFDYRDWKKYRILNIPFEDFE